MPLVFKVRDPTATAFLFFSFSLYFFFPLKGAREKGGVSKKAGGEEAGTFNGRNISFTVFILHIQA